MNVANSELLNQPIYSRNPLMVGKQSCFFFVPRSPITLFTVGQLTPHLSITCNCPTFSGHIHSHDLCCRPSAIPAHMDKSFDESGPQQSTEIVTRREKCNCPLSKECHGRTIKKQTWLARKSFLDSLSFKVLILLMCPLLALICCSVCFC